MMRGFSWRTATGSAARQHNVISLWQLRSLGLSSSAVRYQFQIGRIRRIHRGVYALSAAPLTPYGNWMAAVLACGEGAVISYRSAAALWGLLATSRNRIDVTTPLRAGRQLDGIDSHWTATLLPRDVTVRDGVPCTSVSRTLLDLAAVVRQPALASAIEQAEIDRLFDLRAILDVLGRNRGHRGAARIRAAIAQIGAGAPDLRSEFERRFHPIVLRTSLPNPLTNHWLELPGHDWIEIDFFWPELRLAVETDGLRTHGTWSAQRRDRARDRRLAGLGIQTLRFSWSDLAEPARVRSQLEAVAARRHA